MIKDQFIMHGDKMEQLRNDFQRIDIAEDRLEKHDARITRNMENLVQFMDVCSRVEK